MLALNPHIAPNKTFAEDACSPGGCHNSGAGVALILLGPAPDLSSAGQPWAHSAPGVQLSPAVTSDRPLFGFSCHLSAETPPPAGTPEAPGPGCVSQWGGGGGSHSKGQRGHSQEGVHLQAWQHQDRKDFPPPEEVGIWEGQAEVGGKSWRACLLAPAQGVSVPWGGGAGRGEVVAAQSPHQGPGQETG